MNQNQGITRSQVRNELSTILVDMLMQISADEDLAKIRRRGDAGDSLNVDEFYRYMHLSTGFFRYWENVHFQYRNGLYDEGEFESHMQAIMAAFANSRIRDLWCDRQYWFAMDFREDINARLIRLGYTCN